MKDEPNIFDYATSELSQDAFFAWLFSWAEDGYENNVLHNCAIETLNLFMNTNLDKVNKIDIYKQEKHIDLIIAVDDKYFLVIEDKTNSSEHDNQLIKYKETITDWLDENKLNTNHIEVKYAYYKTGIVLTEEQRVVDEAAYNLITVDSIKSIFDRYKNCKSDIFKSYYDYINSLSENYESVITTSYEEYKDIVSENPAAIYSLYKNLADEFKSDCKINKVNSPSRHSFYTFTFGWDRWTNTDVYFELDGFELRFRLYNFRGKKNQKKVAENALKRIKNISETRNPRCVVEEIRNKSGGNTMKIAAINEKSWLVLTDGKIDIKKTAAKLNKLEKLFFKNE